MKPAFAIRDVSLEQEDVFVESYKADLVKMVRIDPALMDLFLEHQFEWLFFPVTLLPMTVIFKVFQNYFHLVFGFKVAYRWGLMFD